MRRKCTVPLQEALAAPYQFSMGLLTCQHGVSQNACENPTLSPKTCACRFSMFHKRPFCESGGISSKALAKIAAAICDERGVL